MGMNAPHPMHTPAPPGGGNPPFTLAPHAPRPPQQQNNGCSTAMIVVGVVIGVFALLITIAIIVAANSDDEPDPDPTYTTSSFVGHMKRGTKANKARPTLTPFSYPSEPTWSRSMTPGSEWPAKKPSDKRLNTTTATFGV